MSLFSYIQSAQNAVDASSVSLAFGSANTAGNLLVVVVAGFDSGSTPPSFAVPTDTNGNTYVLAITQPRTGGSTSTISIYVAQGCAAGANTVSCTATNNSDISIVILEYAVPANYNLASQTNGLASASPATCEVSTVNTPDEAMIVSAVFDQHNFHTWTSSSASIRQYTDAPDADTLVVGDEDVSSLLGFSSPYTNVYGGAATMTTIAVCLAIITGTSGGGGGGAGSSYTWLA